MVTLQKDIIVHPGDRTGTTDVIASWFPILMAGSEKLLILAIQPHDMLLSIATATYKKFYRGRVFPLSCIAPPPPPSPWHIQALML